MLNQTLPSDENSDQAETDVLAGRRVLDIEAAALSKLSHALNGDFATAVELLSRVKGRVIVTGMGKSGHIGRKNCRHHGLYRHPRRNMSILVKPVMVIWA